MSSVTNKYVAEPAEILNNLVVQMTQPVRYVELVERLIREGVTFFVEVGPRQVLTGLGRQKDFFGGGMPQPEAVMDKPIDRDDFLDKVSQLLGN